MEGTREARVQPEHVLGGDVEVQELDKHNTNKASKYEISNRLHHHDDIISVRATDVCGDDETKKVD